MMDSLRGLSTLLLLVSPMAMAANLTVSVLDKEGNLA